MKKVENAHGIRYSNTIYPLLSFMGNKEQLDDENGEILPDIFCTKKVNR